VATVEIEVNYSYCNSSNIVKNGKNKKIKSVITEHKSHHDKLTLI